jgi:hypothetical protein
MKKHEILSPQSRAALFDPPTDPAATRDDNLGEIVDRYPTVRRMVPVLLGAFVFRSWKSEDTLLAALDVLRDLHAKDQRNLPPRAPTAFLKPAWRKLVRTGATLDRRAYEVAVMMTLRDRLRSGDIWIEGSRAFRAFDDFLLPPETFWARRRENELGLAVSNVFDDWRGERVGLLETRLREIDALAAAGKLTEAVITAEGLSISPIRKIETDETEHIARRPGTRGQRLRRARFVGARRRDPQRFREGVAGAS